MRSSGRVDYVKKFDKSSLRILGTVGEPINPDTWRWYYNVVGEGRCSIVDTWWQTETGGILISPLPGAIPAKPGSATLPFFGIEPVLLSPEGEELKTVVASGLPKTRSGKIMRRILRKVASNETEDLGDITTLADPSIVDTLIKLREELI